MRTVLLLALGFAVFAVAQNSPESTLVPFQCSDVADAAREYLSGHGLGTRVEQREFQGFKIFGPLHEWTDAAGEKVSDFRIYWSYADRRTVENLPFGVWRLRLSHYRPRGELRLGSAVEGCRIDFRLRFETDGANMVAVLGVDSQWGYESNRRMEREYLKEIAEKLKRQ